MVWREIKERKRFKGRVWNQLFLVILIGQVRWRQEQQIHESDKVCFRWIVMTLEQAKKI